jgi:hypothetical protein
MPYEMNPLYGTVPWHDTMLKSESAGRFQSHCIYLLQGRPFHSGSLSGTMCLASQVSFSVQPRQYRLHDRGGRGEGGQPGFTTPLATDERAWIKSLSCTAPSSICFLRSFGCIPPSSKCKYACSRRHIERSCLYCTSLPSFSVACRACLVVAVLCTASVLLASILLTTRKCVVLMSVVLSGCGVICMHGLEADALRVSTSALASLLDEICA